MLPLMALHVEAAVSLANDLVILQHDEIWIRHGDREFQARIYVPRGARAAEISKGRFGLRIQPVDATQ